MPRPGRLRTLLGCLLFVGCVILDWLTDCFTEGEPPPRRQQLRWLLALLLLAGLIGYAILTWRFP